MPNRYKADLGDARMKLAEMLTCRETVEFQIAKQREKVAALAVLAGESEDTFEKMAMGLTAACRAAFRAAGQRGLMPTELRDAVKKLGFPIETYSNPMASLHAVIRRLAEKGEIRTSIRDMHDGVEKSVYQWTLFSWGSPSSLRNMLEDFERDKAARRKK